MTSMIEDLNFFKECDPLKLSLLSSTAKFKSYNASDILMYEEDDVNRVYFLVEGEVKLYKVDRFDNEVFLYTLSDQTLLTDIGSLECNTISCFSNIEFLVPSRVVSFDLKMFKEVVKTDFSLLINLVNLLADQKQRVDCMVSMGMVYDVTAKVAKMLYDQLDLYNRLKKQEISYRLNIQPATLSRVLAKFIRKGLIMEEDHKTVVLQREELTRYFNEGL
ncbi:Crp/Fnr family transcriptional regulator [Sulfuricurvum sp.]|uniref:Crp/Fnr family transcriptional regulator n=1 Tax=Sulfuricurvum sp. TaxID=2025608 RepID=UPI002624FAB5|nr:Crp/Fnr family transcriptional regulator [Sulfuricurvum sp.]MDD2368088.1 Crp/Fnr family transcriptional regulator [Sulfuricurvum sp.]MDD4950333.1 Crp/Fnr family transcriptional regulator [Sulfuricurvum sp.]